MEYIYRASYGTVEKYELVKETDEDVWYKLTGIHTVQESKGGNWYFYGKTFEEAKQKMLAGLKDGVEEYIKEHARTVAHFEKIIAETLALTED